MKKIRNLSISALIAHFAEKRIPKPPTKQRVKNPENELDKKLMLKAEVKRRIKRERNIRNNKA